MSLALLPSELIAEILLDLNFRDLLRCREVCSKFKTLIDDDVRAEYKFELALSGMQDGPSSALAPIQRLDVLRAHQKAWSSFAWTAKENVPVHQGPAWHLCGNVLTQSEGDRTLHFKQIPSATRGIQETEWTIPDVGCDIADIGIDPAQDLLVIIEHFWDGRSEWVSRIHLKALSTGEPHPAGPPEGTLVHKSNLCRYSFSIRTSEQHLGILMIGAENRELLVWDWKIATLRMHITEAEITSWMFLTTHLLVVALTRTRFDDDIRKTVYPPHLAVIDIASESAAFSDSESPPRPVAVSDANTVCAFHFPDFMDDIMVLSVSIQSSSGSSGQNNWKPPFPGSSSPPFSPSSDPEHRFFLVRLPAMRFFTEVICLQVLVPASTLLRALSRSKSESESESESESALGLAPASSARTRRDFVWAEWGKHGARCFFNASDVRHPSAGVCDVHGSVFVTKRADRVSPDGRVQIVVTMRDFNQLAIRRRALAADCESEYEWGGEDAGSLAVPSGEENVCFRVVEQATVLEHAGWFKEEVTTSLPYTERVLVLVQEPEDYGNWDAVMLTEDALVLAKHSVLLQEVNSPSRCCILSI